MVTDLLMSEAVRYYTRDTNDSRDRRDIRVRKETSEDSGVESGHSIENNGKRETHDHFYSFECDQSSRDVILFYSVIQYSF